MTKDGDSGVTLVAIDDGHAMTKVVGPDGLKLKIASRARPGLHGLSDIFMRGNGYNVSAGGYETEGQRFTVGDFLAGEGTRFDGFPYSPVNRVIVHHALVSAGLGGKRVSIATSLPISRYWLQGKANVDAIQRKRHNLSVKVESIMDDVPLAVIENHSVFSEGLAAWIDYAMDDMGQMDSTRTSVPVAIVDIGGRTTDCAVILPHGQVDHQRSGTENIGVLDLYEAVDLAIRMTGKFESGVPAPVLEQAVNTGTITVFGKLESIERQLQEAKHQLLERIYREIMRRVGNGGADMAQFIFVGGGPIVFGDLVSKFPNAFVVEDPDFANARGMYKYMRFVQ